jgi:Mg2+-importing ATPase
MPHRSTGSLSISEAAPLPADAVVERMGSNLAGLDAPEAARRLAEFGPNAIRTHHARALAVLTRQFRSALLLLLLVAALVSAFLGERADAVIIGAILGISVGLGFVNEFRAERAVEALHEQVRHDVPTLRAGQWTDVEVTELVPGDIVGLDLGMIVPADLRILEATNLACDEAVLTGEPEPVEKSPPPVAPGLATADLSSCAFMGTTVREGSGRGLLVATGARTVFGSIALGLGERQPQTAFQIGLGRFSALLAKVAAVLTGSIFVVNLLLRRPVIDSLLFSLAIAVGITPQLLPAVVTTSLATGARRLARKKVLVKRLVGIEDLGNVDVLFTDKTGTLTEGRISFQRALDPAGRPSDEPLLLGLLCNEATPGPDGAVGGNQLDRVLWDAQATNGLDVGAFTRVAELPFDHDRRMSSVLVQDTTRGRVLVTKGAPESVLERCADVPGEAAAVLQAQFGEGNRVVAVAIRPANGLERIRPEDEKDLRLAGFLIFLDPPKATARESLARLRRLGVEVKIVTGDNPTVAEHVCAQLGVQTAGTLTGSQVAALDDRTLGEALSRTTIFARVSPEQKASIIRAQRRSGADVGFLGDGVNDALALHEADVGISVDSAVDVAKDAADVVLLEKDLGVLADGVVEGRRIFSNTIKYVLIGHVLQLRQHVLGRGRVGVPLVSADASLPDPAEQPAVRRRRDDHPDRRGGRGDAGTALSVGHPVHGTVHAGLRAGQLAVRLRHVRPDARGVPRHRRHVPVGVVRRIHLHPEPGDLRHPDAPRAVLPKPSQPPPAHRQPGHGWGRGTAAGLTAGPRAGVRPAVSAVLPGPGGHGRRVPDARGAGQAAVLPPARRSPPARGTKG